MTPDQLKKQIDALEFAQTELVLFLDVHPAEEAARSQWTKNAAELETLKKQYTDLTGNVWPLTQSLNGGSLAWVTSPWPWDNQ